MVLYAYVCVCAFSLHRESPGRILGDIPILFQVGSITGVSPAIEGTIRRLLDHCLILPCSAPYVLGHQCRNLWPIKQLVASGPVSILKSTASARRSFGCVNVTISNEDMMPSFPASEHVLHSAECMA
jgi:hypothetical protein